MRANARKATLRWANADDDLDLLADLVRMYPGEILVRCGGAEVALAWDDRGGYVGRRTDSDRLAGPHGTLSELFEALRAKPAFLR